MAEALPLFGPHSFLLIPPLGFGPKKKKSHRKIFLWSHYFNLSLPYLAEAWQLHHPTATDLLLRSGPVGKIVSSKHQLWAACFCLAARCGPHTAIIWVSVGRGEHFGEAHAKKSLRIALSASLDLTFGIGARLHAPFQRLCSYQIIN